MDQLSELFNHFSVSAGVFYTGNLCGTSNFRASESEEGHLHLLQKGKLKILDHQGKENRLNQPALLFFPRPTNHRLMAEEKDDAHLVCASIKFGTGSRNPLANALPTMLIIKFSDSPSLRTTTELLFTEAFANDEGRAVVTNRLLDVFLVQLFRYVIAKKLINQGLLAGLTHPHLSKALRAIHSDPAHHWTLESLAEMTAMSRSKFAELFRAELGQPCGDYIVECRVSVAQNLLKRGKPVGWVANEVGYESASALARAFRKKVGQSPRQWLADNSGPGATI